MKKNLIYIVLLVSIGLTFGYTISRAQGEGWIDFEPGDPVTAEAMNEKLNILRNALNPTGTMIAFAGTEDKVPDGWLVCDGSSYSTLEKANLFNTLGYSWGGTGSFFRVPDLRGRFLRGLDTRDPSEGGEAPLDIDRDDRENIFGDVVGNRVGSYQEDAMQRIKGTITAANDKRFPKDTFDGVLSLTESIYDKYLKSTSNKHWGYNILGFDSNANGKYKTSGSGDGDGETRPYNAAVIYIIKE